MTTSEKYFHDAMDREIFPNCIECSDDYLSRTLIGYFHKEGCSRGINNWTQISKRLDERIQILKNEEKKIEKILEKKIKCYHCENDATGMFWVRYHTTIRILEAYPVCEIHSETNSHGTRETGFLCGECNLTKNQIMRKLKELKR